MYHALAALKPAEPGTASGAEVAEIAVCLAVGTSDPVILAYPARAARRVRKGGKMGGSRMIKANAARVAAATLAAVAALLGDAKATASVVCAGTLDAAPEARKDYRNAFRFAARHKLPILFVVANGWTRGRRQQLDLRTLHAEFGIPVFSVDANDAIAAYRVATEALHNARHLRGPCVIEALTVHGEHNTAASALDLLGAYMERHGNRPR
jgi:TPP-dependent pyruvate/acetoin dehydrogenase alpha subunit